MPKWRRESEYGTGPRVPLCRELRAQFKAKLHLARRPGRLTLAAEKIGRVLVDMLGLDGRLDPSIDTLAARASVDPSTVTRALARLRELGFVAWTRRLVRDAASSWRTEQTSNAYRLTVPASDVHFAREARSSVILRGIAGMARTWPAKGEGKMAYEGVQAAAIMALPGLLSLAEQSKASDARRAAAHAAHEAAKAAARPGWISAYSGVMGGSRQ